MHLLTNELVWQVDLLKFGCWKNRCQNGSELVCWVALNPPQTVNVAQDHTVYSGYFVSIAEQCVSDSFLFQRGRPCWRHCPDMSLHWPELFLNSYCFTVSVPTAVLTHVVYQLYVWFNTTVVCRKICLAQLHWQHRLGDYVATSFERQILCREGWRELLNPVTSFSVSPRSLFVTLHLCAKNERCL